jgi:hypothetical protein
MKVIVKCNVALFLLIFAPMAAQDSLPAGYPDRTIVFDLLPGFINPPEGYGEVPFYWWQGDTLTRERILWQLDQLSGKGISSLQINYSHRDSGGLTYGLSNPSKPPLFSEAWWNLFRWFSGEACKRDMTVSLSDYTIGVGQGYSMDEAIKDIPELNGSILKCTTVIASGKINRKMAENILSLTGYKIETDSSLVPDSRADLLPEVKGGILKHNFGKSQWKVICVYAEKVIPSYNPMHPESGKAYNHYFFDKFEAALPDKGSGRLNFFFSDELNFRLSGNLWDDRFAAEFKKRKGYDILPHLDELFVNSGPLAPKIRLDYNDVIVSLSEEHFFEPVYKWHQDRGLIFGCDHGGRGRDVTEFGDYFRTQRWNQGPGSDQPRLSKDIIKAKVASSIAHLYERPRVWLEGFHSSGWGTSSADVVDAIFANFIAGYNLLSFHGLYYSTMGGWWEWAPPDNHFRMPYWNQMEPLMNCVRRLSFLLSQGYHNCDVAIIYPTEPVIAEMAGGKSVELAFRTGELLYEKGIDFDFIDYGSLDRSEVEDKELKVSGEKYKVLIVPSMKAIHYSSLNKIEAFRQAGGIIVNIGDLPEANDKTGMNDPDAAALVRKIFSKGRNMIQCSDPKEVPSAIEGKYDEAFKIYGKVMDRPYVMHRIIGRREVYALYNIPEGTRCFFRSEGDAQLWNPWNGRVTSLSASSEHVKDGTDITLPLTSKEIQIIVFDPDGEGTGNNILPERILKEYDTGNEWEFELRPSLDNRWGDYELPAENRLLGPEIRQLYLSEDQDYTGGLVNLNASSQITCGFGPHFVKLGPLPQLPQKEEILNLAPSIASGDVSIAGKKYKWEDYAFSWQLGVEGDYGHQGYHGLKGEMYDNFIRLGSIEEVKMSLKRVPEKEGNYYILAASVIAPEDGNFELLTGRVKPALLYVNNLIADSDSKVINLKSGANTLLMIFDRACETFLVFREEGKPRPQRQPVSMCWYKDYGVLPFAYPDERIKSGLYTFESAPALQEITFSAYGKVTVWVDGIQAITVSGNTDPDGLTRYSAKPVRRQPGTSRVALKIEYKTGYSGGGAIPSYIRQTCGKGSITLGDWSETDGLKSYSGGAWYRKFITIDSTDLKHNIEIDLGDLVSSAELFVNGKSSGIRLAPPWTFDISEYAMAGKNQVEVLVYNTLANNYVAIPTRYMGSLRSGLIGPVRVRVYSQ